jgi:hypothetical protein
MSSWIWTAIVVVLVAWYASRIEKWIRPLLRARERRVWILDTQNPVFSLGDIRWVHEHAFEASKKMRDLHAQVWGDPAFEADRKQRKVSAPFEAQLLRICEAVVDAEKWWFRHGVMVDANLAATTGKNSRDDALRAAVEKMKLMDEPLSLAGKKTAAERAKDEWKLVLESEPGENRGKAVTSRAWSNPWADRAWTDDQRQP